MKRNKLPNNTQQYIRGQQSKNLQRGDKVRIIQKAEGHSNGWRNGWVYPMDDVIGCTGTVLEINGDHGIRVAFADSTHTYAYPYFVLKKVQ